MALAPRLTPAADASSRNMMALWHSGGSDQTDSLVEKNNVVRNFPIENFFRNLQICNFIVRLIDEISTKINPFNIAESIVDATPIISSWTARQVLVSLPSRLIRNIPNLVARKLFHHDDSQQLHVSSLPLSLLVLERHSSHSTSSKGRHTTIPQRWCLRYLL